VFAKALARIARIGPLLRSQASDTDSRKQVVTFTHPAYRRTTYWRPGLNTALSLDVLKYHLLRGHA
jgi:hypothetical protein